MKKELKRHWSIEALTYEKATFSFWFMSALAYPELFDLGRTRFIEAFFEGESSCRVNPALKSIGIYNGVAGKSTTLIAPEGAGTTERLEIFYRWLGSDDAIDFFKSRIKLVDDTAGKPDTYQGTYDRVRLGVDVRNFIEMLQIVRSVRKKNARRAEKLSAK